MKICTACRSQLPDTYTACPNCGNTNLVMDQNNMQQQPVMPGQPMGNMQQMPGPGYQQAPVADNCGIGWLILSFLIPLAGIILFFVWKNTKPQSAKKCGIVGLVGWAFWFIVNIMQQSA